MSPEGGGDHAIAAAAAVQRPLLEQRQPKMVEREPTWPTKVAIVPQQMRITKSGHGRAQISYADAGTPRLL